MALEQQMAEAFNGVDPVSGNDVPVGSKPEEVRDDIPAQLSEGEYVVPADVVRFYGVNFFEKLRTKAKAGWQQMEQDGRVGGEPVAAPEMEDDDELPFDVSELDAVEMADGGIISPLKAFSSNTVTYKEYVNDAGDMRLIPFFRDMPMSVIPDGFYLKGSKAAEDAAAAAEKKAASEAAQTDDGGNDDNVPNVPEPVDYTKLSDIELAKMVEDQTSFGVDDVAKMGLGLVSPVIGGLVSLAMADSARRTRNELERRINDPATPDALKAKYGDMLEKAQAGRVGILDKLLGNVTDLTAKPTDVIGDPLALPADMRKAIEAEIYRGGGPTQDTIDKLKESGFEGFGVPMDNPAAYQTKGFDTPPGMTTPGRVRDPFEDARIYNLDGGDEEGATAADISAVKGQSTTAEVTSRPTYDTEKVLEISRSGGGNRGSRDSKVESDDNDDYDYYSDFSYDPGAYSGISAEEQLWNKGGYVSKKKGLASKRKSK